MTTDAMRGGSLPPVRRPVRPRVRTSGFRTALLAAFILVVWLVPSSLNLIGTHAGASPDLLSGLNTRSIFYPLFALFAVLYVTDRLLLPRLWVRRTSSKAFMLAGIYVAFVGAVLQLTGHGYSIAIFPLGMAFLLTYTFAVFATATGGRGANHRVLVNVMIGAGVVLSGVLMVEAFVIRDSLYELLFGHDPAMWMVMGELEDRSFGTLDIARAYGPLSTPLRTHFLLLLPFALVLSKIAAARTAANLGTVALLAVVSGGIVATGSLGSMVAAMVMTGTYSMLHLWGIRGGLSRRTVALGLGAGAVVLLVASPLRDLVPDIIDLLSGESSSGRIGSLARRFFLINEQLGFWIEQPVLNQLLGYGFGWYWYDQAGFEAAGWQDNVGMYFAWLPELGLAGLGLVLLSGWLWFRSAIRQVRTASSAESRGFFAAIAAYVVGVAAAFASFDYYNMLYVIAIAYAMYVLRAQEVEREASARGRGPGRGGR